MIGSLCPMISTGLRISEGRAHLVVYIAYTLGLLWLTDFMGRRNEAMSGWKAFMLYHRLRRWIWGALGVVILSILAAVIKDAW